MKNIILLLLLLSSLIADAQIVNIPDSNFKNALVNTLCVDTNNDGIPDDDVDTNNDGEIQVSEAEVVISLLVMDNNIISMDGIGSFINIEHLNCASNASLTNLDVSQNLDLVYLNCGYSSLTNLDLSHNLDLVYLNCGYSSLTNLDLSHNLNLVNIYCDNSSLVSLSIPQTPTLEELYCHGNQLTSLTTLNNTGLIWLAFSANNLTNIDVSQNSNLQYLLCYGNSLTSLDVSENPNLKLIQCSSNEITSLDLSQNPNFDELICYDNQLIELNLKNGNNHNMAIMRCLSNPNLSCIQVDDVDYANSQNSWHKDANAYYSEDCTMGITGFLETNSFKLSPNPVKNTLNLETKNSYGVAHINIYSSLGINIFQTSLSLNPQISLDLSSLSGGVYFIEISSNQGKEIHKIIKK